MNAQLLFWARHFGGTPTDRGFAMQKDKDGNSIVGGVFDGTVDFDSSEIKDTITTNGGVGFWDVIVSKLDKDGNLLWLKQFCGSKEEKKTTDWGTYGEYSRAICINKNDNIF